MKKILLTALALGAAWWAGAVTPEELSNQLYLQIVSSYNAQNWERVTELVEQLIDAGADIDEFEITYSNALAQSGRAEEAATRLEAYLEKCPDDYQGWNALGDIQSMRSMTDQAIEAYAKSSELNPMFARPCVAIARLKAASDPAASVQSYCQAMRIFLLAEQPQGAIQFGSEAMGIDPKNTQLLILLGEALSQAGLEDKALPFYAEAVSIASEPAAPDLETVGVGTDRIGMIYYKQGEYAKSLAFLNVLTANDEILGNLDPEMAQELLLLTAANNQKLDLGDEAAAMLEKARGIDPESDIDSFYQSLLQLGE